MNAKEYHAALILSHPHVGLTDDKKRQEVKCSCGWSYRHPRYGERRAAILEHLHDPVNH